MKCDELKPLMCANEPNVRPMYDKYEVDAAIAELKAEINRKDGVGQRWFERCMEARTENRKLKRALYKACANWAYWVDHALTTKFLYNNSYETKLERDRWYNMECKCKAKAEEYK